MRRQSLRRHQSRSTRLRVAVDVAIIGDRRFSASCRRDGDLGALGLDGGADGVAVVATVGDQPVEPTCRRFDQRGRHCHVGGVAGRDQQDARASRGVGQSVDLAGAATARGADALEEGPPFAPAAERWTLMLVESIATDPHTPL